MRLFHEIPGYVDNTRGYIRVYFLYSPKKGD